MNHFASKAVTEFAFRDILYEKQDWVGRITINRPESFNCYTTSTLEELTLAINDASNDVREKVADSLRIFLADAEVGSRAPCQLLAWSGSTRPLRTLPAFHAAAFGLSPRGNSYQSIFSVIHKREQISS